MSIRTVKLMMALLALSLPTIAHEVNGTKKVSPYLESLLQQTELRTDLKKAPAQGTATIDALMKLSPEADEEALANEYGFEVLNRIGDIRIVRLPFSAVTALAAQPEVLRIEAERAPRPMLDQVGSQIGSDKANTNSGNWLPQAYTGKGVVVGIVDCGFDYIHPMFRDGNGISRVMWAADYIADQKYTTRKAIDFAMHSSDASTMYHGTHVTGIAAGSRVQDGDWDEATSKTYQGVAPEAQIAMGAVNSVINTDGSGLSAATSIQAFADIFQYADEQGMPCVINYSMGDAMTFSDSRQLEEESIRTLLSKPGRALVVSSGNSGSSCRLAHKTAELTEGGTGIMFHTDDSYGQYLGVELKVKSTQSLRFRLTDASYSTNKAEISKTVEELLGAKSISLSGKTLQVINRGTTGDEYQVLYITSGTKTFTVSERVLLTIKGEGDAWAYADPLCAPFERVTSVDNHALAEEGYSMTWPAMMPEVVTVGNVAHRFQIVTLANKYASQGGEVTPTDLTAYESTKGEGYLAKSSSVGPTLTGATKPDVCAPGVNIVSAQNFFIDDDTYYAVAAWDICGLDTEPETWGTESGYFHMMAQTGTSMSAPAVTGTIALWMQANPELTTADIKEIIAKSSRQPDEALSYPNNQYGYGEIDAYKGLLHINNLDGIRDISQHQPEQAQIKLNGKLLTIAFQDNYSGEFSVRIYSTDGRLVKTSSELETNLERLPHGVYAVQVSTRERATTGSTLIRM